MLTLYRRHNALCGRKDRYWKRCQCAMWVEGTLDRQYMRKSLHTQSWERARAIVDDWEHQGAPNPKSDMPTIQAVFDSHLAECREAGLSEITIYNRTRIMSRLIEWCDQNNYKTINELDSNALRQFFAGRNIKVSTRIVERSTIKEVFVTAIRQKIVTHNPVVDLVPLTMKTEPTEYLEKEQFAKFLAAIDESWTRALVLLLRWSGLRIGDALNVSKNQIKDGMLLLHQQKTGTPVHVPLPPEVLEGLGKIEPNIGSRYFVAGKVTYIEKRYAARRIEKAGKASGRHVHPHMLRDTFAIELLLAGVPIDQVSKLLGHKSIKTTELHYSPWVKARQDQLNASIRQAWPKVNITTRTDLSS